MDLFVSKAKNLTVYLEGAKQVEILNMKADRNSA